MPGVLVVGGLGRYAGDLWRTSLDWEGAKAAQLSKVLIELELAGVVAVSGSGSRAEHNCRL